MKANAPNRSRKEKSKNMDKKIKIGQNMKATENLTQQLLGLKHTFTQVLNSVCRGIEKDFGDIGNEEKAKDLNRIKQKYSNLREEVCRIISEYGDTLSTPISKEETAAVQDGLNQCLHYLNRVHNSMESILKKYEDTGGEKKRCCDKEEPHIHKNMDGNHIIIHLQQGTQSEMEYVSHLMNNVNCLPEEERKYILHKMCHSPESEEELGAGDDIKRHTSTGRGPTLKLFQNQNNVVQQQEVDRFDFFINNRTRNDKHTPEYRIVEPGTHLLVPPRQELYQDRYIPEKIIDSLLAGYSWSNCSKELDPTRKKIEDKKEMYNENLVLCGQGLSTKYSNCYKNNEHKISDLKPQGPTVFDSKGNPLTDSKGVPLKNILGYFLVKYQNKKPVSTLNGEPVFDQNSLPFVINLDKPLCNINGEPLRLFNKEGIPLTDFEGKPLKLDDGKFSIQLDRYNRLTSDVYGQPLYESNGIQITTSITESVGEQPSNSELPTSSERTIPYNEKYSLINSNGKILNDFQGNPTNVKHKITGAMPGKTDRNVYESGINNYSGIPDQRKKLALYDCNKYPLTNSEGYVLQDVEGKQMVVFDKKGKPIKDFMNRLLYDCEGHSSDSSSFNPYKNNKFRNKIEKNHFNKKVNVQIYDFKGYPLLDIDGGSLLTSDGKPLIVHNDKGDIIHDLNGYPVFDKSGIPLTKINNCWTTPNGLPYKVFDSNGFPLTSDRGEVLFNSDGKSIIKLDYLGRPIETLSGVPVCDVNGIPVTHSEFNPCHSPPNSTIIKKLYMYNKPMKVFNHNGMPLTDTAGVAMLDSKGRDLMQFNVHGIPMKDAYCNTIFDEYKIPLNCRQNEIILSMIGKPLRLYDNRGRPLTDINGFPLNLANGICTIKFDNAGRPISDFRNSDLYDCNNRILQDPHADPELSTKEKDQIKLLKKDGQPLRVYNREGMPLTDKEGRILVNSNNTHLCLDKDKYPVSDWNGDPLYNEMGQPLIKISKSIIRKESEIRTDPFGRPLRDAYGEAQFDKYGRPLYDLYRRRLYDDKGRPVSNAFGNYLVTNLPEPVDVDLSFDPVILNSGANTCEETLTDLIGGPLFDYFGIPLYNEFGKPLIDIYGRPLYDDNGMPLCDSAGRPVSILARKNDGVPVQVKDVYKTIEVNKEVADLIENYVKRSTRIENSPNIPGFWILPSNIDIVGKKNLNNHSKKKMYWALVRITTFDDGKKNFEILEAKPYNSAVPYN